MFDGPAFGNSVHGYPARIDSWPFKRYRSSFAISSTTIVRVQLKHDQHIFSDDRLVLQHSKMLLTAFAWWWDVDAGSATACLIHIFEIDQSCRRTVEFMNGKLTARLTCIDWLYRSMPEWLHLVRVDIYDCQFHTSIQTNAINQPSSAVWDHLW